MNAQIDNITLFIPLLIGIYFILLLIYYLLKKMPVWVNKRKHLLSNKDRKLIKKLLYYLEETTLWEDLNVVGLCQLIRELKGSNKINRIKYKRFMQLLRKIRPHYIYPDEFISDAIYWFNRFDKNIRINYLKRLLNE